MNTGQHLISQYNHLDGKPADVKMLRSYYFNVTDYIDSTGTGPYVPALVTIQKKIASAIKKLSNLDLDNYHVEIKVDKLVKVDGEKRKVKNQPSNLKPPSASDLSGLQNIQDDAHLRGDALSGSDPVYQVITDKILSLIKDEGLIWRKPWNAKVNGPTDMAHNHVTKHAYSGANFYLNYLLLKDYSSPKFFTFNQVTKLGGLVLKDQKGWPVIYFKWLYKHIATNKLVDEREAIQNGKLVKGYDKFPALFYYKVFNLEQCEGLKIEVKPSKKKTPKEKIESAEQILDAMPKRPKIQKGDAAWYKPQSDIVQLVPLDQFKVDQEYYSVAFHELIHSTGHKDRVGRDLTGRFGTKNYAFEELIAELGASFLCGESGILYFTLKNSAAYIQGWSKKLKEEMARDPKFFLQAASQAHKASEFMLARGPYHDLQKISPTRTGSPTRKANEKKVALAGSKKVKTKKSVKSKESVHQRSKIAKVLHEFKDKKLKTPQGKVVKKEKQAVAIALREAKVVRPGRGKSQFSGVVDASALAGVQYGVIELGPFKSEFHKLNSDSTTMIWGMPGSGKTVKLLQMGQHFAETGKKVLYIAEEEFGKSTLAEKINTFHIGHKNLSFTGDLDESILSRYDVIFFDSINSLKLSPADVKTLQKKFPNKLFMLIVQTTKAGDFRGGQDWEHLVDIAGEIKNRKLILRKNRLDPNNGEKAEKLNTSDAIEEAKKKIEIKRAVKAELEPKQEKNQVI